MRRTLLILFLLVLPSQVWAANYLVNPVDGNDANSCANSTESATRDWVTELRRTIQGALACVAPGDTITLLHGTYTGALNVIDSAVSADLADGAAGLTVTIQAFRPTIVTLQPPDGSSCVALRSTTDYIALLNLTCDMSLQTGARCGVLVEGTANHINMERLTVKNSLGNGICLQGTGTLNTVRNQNYVFDNDGHGILIESASNDVQDNRVYANGDNGIHSTGTTNTIRRNFIFGNNVDGGTAYGLVCDGGDLCYNNVVYENRGGIQGTGTAALIDHNTIYGNTPGIGLRIDGSASSAVTRCNAVAGNTTNISDAGTGTTQTNNLTTATFTNTATDDYSIPTSSTAFNGCTVVIGNPINTSILHHPRTLGTSPDVGAYEAPPGCTTFSDGVADTTCTVTGGDVAELRLALYTAACGETIALEDSGEWTVPDGAMYVVPTKGLTCTTYTTITRTGTMPAVYDVLGNCYVKGPNFAAEMAARDACWEAMKTQYEGVAPHVYMTTAEANANTGVVFGLQANADYWKFSGFEVSTTSTNVHSGGSNVSALFLSGFTGPSLGDFPREEADLPNQVLWERMSLHGNPNPALGPISKALYVGGTNLSLKDSLCYGIKAENDAQCFMSTQGSFYLLENNFLEANGENVLFGGGGSHYYGHTPSDIVQRYNYMTKDWRQWDQSTSRVGITYGGQSWIEKNVNECKNCIRNEIHQNVIEGSWYGSQTGNLMLFQAVSDGDGATWTTVRDIEIWGNVLRHGNYGILFAGKGGQNGGATQGGDLNVHDNLLYNLTGVFSSSGTVTSGGTCFQFLSGASNGITHAPMDDIVWNHNTCDNNSASGELLSTADIDIGYTGFTYTNNIARAFAFANAIVFACLCNGMGDGGLTYFDETDSWVFKNNVWAHESTEWTLPPAATDIYFENGGSAAATLALYKAFFVDRDNGDYTVAAGSPYKAGGARDSTTGTDLGANMSLLPEAGEGGEGEVQGRRPRLRMRVK